MTPGAAKEHPSTQMCDAVPEQTTRDGGQTAFYTHVASAPVAGSDFPAGQAGFDTHDVSAGGEQTEDGSATARVVPKPKVLSPLADPFLALLADVREDAQQTRIANENRLRHLTRTEADEDGEVRGLGMDERNPDVARQAELVKMLSEVEHQATLNLNRRMRKHPLGPWCKAQKGIGQGTLPARLLSIIGDPYVNMQTGQPRTVSQLWSYCGHGDPTRKKRKGMSQEELFALGNPDAKKVLHLIAESCMKAGGPYRAVYDERREITAERVHATDCVRCGPSGKPAPAGSPWSKAHQQADALRIVGKEILRDLWQEAKRIHEEES